MISPAAIRYPEHRFQALLEFAAELGAGDQGAEVQRQQPLRFQRLGYVAMHDALRQPSRRSCRPLVHRSAPDCFWSAATAPGWFGESHRRGQSPDRLTRRRRGGEVVGVFLQASYCPRRRRLGPRPCVGGDGGFQPALVTPPSARIVLTGAASAASIASNRYSPSRSCRRRR